MKRAKNTAPVEEEEEKKRPRVDPWYDPGGPPDQAQEVNLDPIASGPDTPDVDDRAPESRADPTATLAALNDALASLLAESDEEDEEEEEEDEGMALDAVAPAPPMDYRQTTLAAYDTNVIHPLADMLANLDERAKRAPLVAFWRQAVLSVAARLAFAQAARAALAAHAAGGGPGLRCSVCSVRAATHCPVGGRSSGSGARFAVCSAPDCQRTAVSRYDVVAAGENRRALFF